MNDGLVNSDSVSNGSPTAIIAAALQHEATDCCDRNVSMAVTGIERAAAAGANLVVTQELVASQYFCQTEDAAVFDLAQPIPGPLTETFAKAAAENCVVVVASLFEKRAAGVYHNTAVVFDTDGRIAGRYRKMHIPDDPLYYEKFYFTPGDADSKLRDPSTERPALQDGFHAVDTSIGRIGVVICWDQWYPEAARLTALDGANVICIPTAIGHHPCERNTAGSAQLDAWQTIQRSHAIANGLYVIVANRIGHEATPNDAGEGIDFWGHSFIVGPDGVVLAEAIANDVPHTPTAEPEVVLAVCDFERLEQHRREWPFFRDRRIDAYDGLTSRWRQ